MGPNQNAEFRHDLLFAECSNLIGWCTCNSNLISTQPGNEANVILTLSLSLSLPPPQAKGTMKPDSAGLVAGMASKASKLKHGMGADDQPVVVIEFDTGYITMSDLIPYLYL